MYFSTVEEFLHMGGHGFYVWLAYAITFVVVGIMLIQPRIKRRRILKAIQARQYFEETL